MTARVMILACAVVVVLAKITTGAVITSSSRAVSPTVFASHLMRDSELVLLVLWRGSPGWFWQREGGQEGTGSSGDRTFQLIGAGGLTFRIDYDFRAGSASMLGRDISLRETNVVLVDFVDDVRGPVIVATQRTGPGVDGAVHPESIVIRRHPALYDFLQCNVQLPESTAPDGPLKQKLIASSCEEMRRP